MTVTVDIRLNSAQIYATFNSKSGLVGRDIFRRAKRVEGLAKRLCRVDTGRLRASITTDMDTRPGRITARVGTNVNYAMFVHNGTGIYGPRGRPIVPTRGKVLVFTPKGAGRPVFARSVRGMPKTEFLTKALPAAR
jgi:phage gpG-like protein